MPGMPQDSAQANETQKQQPLGRASFRENTAHVVALGPFHLSPVGTAGQSLSMEKLLCTKRSEEVSLQKTGTQEAADTLISKAWCHCGQLAATAVGDSLQPLPPRDKEPVPTCVISHLKNCRAHTELKHLRSSLRKSQQSQA